MTCSNCGKESASLKKIAIKTGKRGRPPIKLVCDACLGSRATAGDTPARLSEAPGTPVKYIPGFDPACIYLLDLLPENLFEKIGRGEQNFRCKGCKTPLMRWERREHFTEHKSNLQVAA